MAIETKAEERLAHLYNQYNKVPDLRNSLPLAGVLLVNIGAAAYSLLLNPESDFAHHYKQLYGWIPGLAAFYPASQVVDKLENLSHRKKVGIVMQIAAFEGREVHENNRDQLGNELIRAQEVIRLGTDNTSPGLLHTGLFNLGYLLNRRGIIFERVDNLYKFTLENDFKTFDFLASYLKYDEITNTEIVRDALIMHKYRLLEEAKRPKISDRGRVYASRLVLEIDNRLGGLPPLIPHQAMDN